MILGIYGAGGLGREVSVLTDIINKKLLKWEKIVFIDDILEKKKLKNMEVYTFEEFKKNFSREESEIIISMGEPENRKMIFNKILEYKYNFATIIHPDVYISQCTKVGQGSIIYYGGFVSCDVIIGENVLILPNCNIGHDVIIGNNSVISGATNIAGMCEVGENTYIGMSTIIKENVKIGNFTIIGLGSVVVRDIPNDTIALGNPARPMKKNDEKKVFK